MSIFKNQYPFKTILKDSNNFHRYYNNLISLKKLPKFNKSISSSSIFSTKHEEENKLFLNKKNDNNETQKIDFSLGSSIFNKLYPNKIILKPIPKRKMIYNEIINNSNSILSKNRNKTFRVRNMKKIQISSYEYKNIKLNLNFNTLNDYEKEFFPDFDYSNLEYNEYNIHKDKSIYEKLIKEKIDYFKKNKNENHTIQFEKKLYYGKNKKEINLVFNSIEISFKDMSLPDDLQNKNLKINFPFYLLPIFYYKGFEAFIKFLSVVIKIENSFAKIYLDEEKIKEALNNLQVYNIEKEEDKKSEYGLNYPLFLKNEKIIHLRPNYIDRNKNDLKFNYLIFFWITNLTTYIVKITLPCIHLNILNNKLQISHFIDFELLFFLYQRNFLNWEYYIIKYLTSYSKFRDIIQNIDSSSKIYNKIVFLKEPKTKVNKFSEENLINVYTDQFNNNKIISFKSFFVIVKYKDLNFQQEKTYYIYFNFYHYIKLYKLSKYSSKLFFLSNFLEIDNEFHSLKFNFDEFENFNIKTWISNMKHFSDLNIKPKIISDDLYKEFNFFSKNIKIEFRRPRWSLITYQGQNEISKTWEIGKELEKEFIESIIDSSSDSWTNFLNSILQKVDEFVPEELTKNHSKKKLKKKNNRSRTNSASRVKREKQRIKSRFPNNNK